MTNGGEEEVDMRRGTSRAMQLRKPNKRTRVTPAYIRIFDLPGKKEWERETKKEREWESESVRERERERESERDASQVDRV